MYYAILSVSCQMVRKRILENLQRRFLANLKKINVLNKQRLLHNTLPIAKILSVKNARHGSQWWKWAGLAVLFSRQLLNGSQDFNFSVIF